MVVNSSVLGLLWGIVILFSAGTSGDDVSEVRQTQGPISVLRGQDFTLECLTVGTEPSGPVKWFMGQVPARKTIYSDKEPSDRVTRTKPNDNNDFTITIHNFVPADAGIYYCVKQKTIPSGVKDFRSGRGTEVVERSESEKQLQNPEESRRSVIMRDKLHRAVVVPIAAGTVCILLAISFSVALYFYIKKKRGKKSCPSRTADPFPESPRTPHQTSAGKEDIVYIDVKHSGSAQKPRQSKPEEHSTYATIR